MHFAAFAYVGESVSDPAKYYTNNVIATINLLETMRMANVKDIIFSSTCATYGIPLEEKITETHPQTPVNPYGRSKLMIEHILSDYEKAYGFNFVALRYFNAAGADPQQRVGERHLPETHLVPCVLKAAHDPGQTFSIFGTDYNTPDGTCIRDFIHTTDLASAHILALRYLLEKGQSTAFNLGYGNGFSILDILNRARKITGKKIEIEYQNKRQGDPPRLVGNPAKAFSTLNWKPQYNDLDLILSTAWQWHEKDWK
jgi:UDP-glucose 4-epimerase